MKADRGEESPWYSWRIQISKLPRKPTFYEYHRSNSPCCWVVFPQVKSALTASKYLRDPNFARRWRSPCVSMFCNEQRFPCWMYALLYVSVVQTLYVYVKYACASGHCVQSPFPFPHFSPLMSKSCKVLPFLNAKFLQYKSWCGFEKSIERLKRLSCNLIIN